MRFLPTPSTEISTHTPLAGRDVGDQNKKRADGISTHTPLAGRDLQKLSSLNGFTRFLLTRPSRGVTRNFPLFSALC